jgi:hypothetical protein
MAAMTRSRAVNRAARHFLVPGADDDLVDAADRGLAGLAEAAGHAGQVLQLERDVFQDVARPGAFLQAHQEAAALPGLQRCSISVGSHADRRS